MDNEPNSLKKMKQFPWEAWAVRLSALLTAAMGIINLLSAVKPALQSRLVLIDGIVPLLVRHGTRVTSALAGFALILLASSLLRRKRTAWVLTVIVLFVSIVTHLLKGLDFEEASLGLILLIVLVIFRHSFHASSDRPSVRHGISVLVLAFVFTLTYGAAGFYLLDRHFRVHYSLLDALRQTVVMFSSFYNPGLEPLTGFGRYFAGSIYVIGLGTVGFALVMLIRPVLVREPATAEERMRAEEIVHKYGHTFLARAALFEDKSYYFGPGETVIAYAASGRGAMALGDPIGPESQVAAAINGFLGFCSRNDWTPAFASVLPDHLDAYRKAGMDALCIGYEAIVHLDKFSLQGGENKGIRYSINRLEKNGYKATVYQPPLDDHLMETLHSISEAWLTLHHGGEMRFSDGWFHDSYIRNGPVIVVQTADGSPTAFANLVPEYQKNELSIDLMRHYKNADHGTMEYLFAKMLLWAKQNGYDSFSLGLSAIVGVGEKPEDPRVERALHTLSDYISRFYNFRGLHEFKEKFHPCWEPRYLVYPGPASLPLILTTMLRVHSGNDFLWKFLRK